jgi:hypothetical protein
MWKQGKHVFSKVKKKIKLPRNHYADANGESNAAHSLS